MPLFTKLTYPAKGEKITIDSSGKLQVPDNPIIPFITGDGTGRDIMKASLPVLDAGVEKAYGGKRKIEWFKIYAGDEARAEYHPDKTDEELMGLPELTVRSVYLPDDTFNAIKEFRVAIKGPLTTPVGEGIRSLNVTLRQILDLYACVRPVKYYGNIPSPVRRPQDMDVVVFRENTEDVYMGIEWKSGSPEALSIIDYLNKEQLPKMRKELRQESGIGIKPISAYATKRLTRMAISFALSSKRKSVTLMHKGNIMKFTEGAFRNWGYEVAKEEFRKDIVTEREWGILNARNRQPSLNSIELAKLLNEEGWEGFDYDAASDTGKSTMIKEIETVLNELYKSHGGEKLNTKLVIKDRIADSLFQQLLTRTKDYDVIVTPNLNGDYISDAAVAQVGGLGVAAGANMGDGLALFEATHGTAPKYADLDVINPSAVILSGVMMLEYLGWKEAADIIIKGFENTLLEKKVTYDLARLMKAEGWDDVHKIKCSEFGNQIIYNIGL